METTAELAIRKYCLEDCRCGSHKQVQECTVIYCPLHGFRADSEDLEDIEIVVRRKSEVRH